MSLPKREFVKHSVECTWNLAEAQQKLGNLALHNSESRDQECAQAKTEAAELRWREEEWRRKEEALNQRERQNLWNTDLASKEVFNKGGDARAEPPLDKVQQQTEEQACGKQAERNMRTPCEDTAPARARSLQGVLLHD